MSGESRSLAELQAGVSALVERNRFDQARSMLADALQQHPEDPTLNYLSALTDYHQDRNDDALQTVTRVLQQYPEYAQARNLLFDLYREQGRHVEAEEVILGLLRDYPGEAIYYADYALLMLATLNTEKALSLANEAVRLSPDNTYVMRAVVLARLASKPTEEAVQALRDMLEADPSSEGTAHTVLVVLAEQDRDAEALAIAQELLRQNPQNEHLVELIIHLRSRTHWTMKPLWPVLKYGWAGSAGLWFGFIALIYALGRVLPDDSKIFPVITVAILAYVAYSWIWPSLLRKWLSR